MSPKTIIGIIACSLLAASSAFGASWKWDPPDPGADKLWTTAGNWSQGTVPTSSDVVLFDGLRSNADCTMDATASAKSIELKSNYTGTVTANAGFTVPNYFYVKGGTFNAGSVTHTVDKNFTLSGGTFNCDTSTFLFSGSVGNTTVSGGPTFYKVQMNKTGGKALSFGGSSSVITDDFTLTSGTLNGGTVSVQGDLTTTTSVTGGSGTITFNGTGAQSLSGAASTSTGSLPRINIDKAAETLTLAGSPIRTESNWTYTQGTISEGTTHVVLAGGLTVSGAMTFYDLTVQAARL